VSRCVSSPPNHFTGSLFNRPVRCTIFDKRNKIELCGGSLRCPLNNFCLTLVYLLFFRVLSFLPVSRPCALDCFRLFGWCCVCSVVAVVFSRCLHFSSWFLCRIPHIPFLVLIQLHSFVSFVTLLLTIAVLCSPTLAVASLANQTKTNIDSPTKDNKNKKSQKTTKSTNFPKQTKSKIVCLRVKQIK